MAQGAPREEDATELSTRPVGEIIDHIIARHHAPLKRQLAELEALVRGGAVAGPLAGQVMLFVEELGQHLVKEERVAFQMIRASAGYEGVAFGVMEHEHALVDGLLDALRAATRGWLVPAEAAAPHARVLGLLAAIDADLPVHAALEEALFARVRARGSR